MNELINEAINTALNNPRDWRIAILVIAILVAIGLFTGYFQKLIARIFKRNNKGKFERSNQSQKITIVGSYNSIEGQTIGTEMRTQTKAVKEQNNKTHIQCQIETLTIDNVGDGLSFVFIDNRYFASIEEINGLCSKSKVVQGAYNLTEDQVVQLLSLFKLFNPNGITVSYSEDLKTAIARELEYRDISLEIITAIEVAKRLPFQKLKNNHFGANNHSLGVFVNKK